MDNTTRLLMMGAAGAANPTYVEDVFSTYLYTGNGSTQTITNGIDLSGKGGLVWLKNRNGTSYGNVNHCLHDSARGVTQSLASNNSSQQFDQTTGGVTAFNASGFSLGSYPVNNDNGYAYASWTFRKQPKFFDVVTYTGTGSNRTIAHNLGSVPGSIIVKRTDTTADWAVYHRSLANTQYLVLNTTAAAATGATWWNSTTPTSSVFSVGTDASVNASGGTYVAYVFAHDAGGFGDSGNDSVVSCGTMTSAAPVNLGWEPQWVLLKTINTTSQWVLLDTMRGFDSSNSPASLYANLTNAEAVAGTGWSINSTGFSGVAAGTYIYIAIRRGPMKTPTVGTSVFNAVTYTGTGTNSRVFTGAGFPVDAAIIIDRPHGNGYPAFIDRVRGGGNYLVTVNTLAESTGGYNYASRLDSMDGYTGGTNDSGSLNQTGLALVNHYFRRAPGFFDVVAYTGTGSYPLTVNHNLGVTPELIITKTRTGSADSWYTYAKPLTSPNANWYQNYVALNQTASTASDTFSITTAPSSTTIIYAAYYSASSVTYVNYLFATCPGVSKVGSYTGTGTTLQINCGFTAGARFVMIKRTDSTGDWYVWDTARGIVSGNDSYLLLNSTAAEVTNTDYIDPLSSGFEISSTAPAAINANGGSFIYLAVA